MKVLSTDRLYLRTWEENDFGLARGLWGDPDVMTFLGGPLTDDDYTALAASWITPEIADEAMLRHQRFEPVVLPHRRA